MYYVYVIEQKDKKRFYIGYTENLKRRLKQHKRKGNSKIVYYEAYRTSNLARRREKRLKYYGSAWRALRKRITA